MLRRLKTNKKKNELAEFHRQLYHQQSLIDHTR